MFSSPTITNDTLGGGTATHAQPPVESWKRALLPAYYAATWPLREWDGRRLAARGRAPIVVVAYHRVADDRATRWTISNREFRQHIDWLARHFDLVSLAEAQRRVAAEENHRPAVSITFDDGYADNCHEALPLLIRRRIPCTYFVTSQAVLEDRAFAHDTACGVAPRPNSVQQLRALVAAGIEIGAHTRTHADLGTVTDPAVLYDEVIAARDELQSALDCRIRYFAFPFGQHANLSPAAFALAKENGFDGVVSAYGGYNFPGDDPFHLQRACVDGPTARLKIAVNLDPYKQLKIRRYEYR